jgi:hypothetical protein
MLNDYLNYNGNLLHIKYFHSITAITVAVITE